MVDKKKYGWEDLYENALDKTWSSPDMKAKDEARFEYSEMIKRITGVDIEKAECPEDEIECFLEKFPVLFYEDGKIVPNFEPIFLYVPAANQILMISEGTGDALSEEDLDDGMVDYVYWEQYEVSYGFPEEDGGIMTSQMLIQERYATLFECIPDVMEMAYGSSKLEYVVMH